MTNSPKVWLVTGASQGFGRAVTEHVLKAGHKVVATMRKPSAFADIQKTYNSESLLVVKLDVTKQGDINAAFDDAKRAFGRIDVVLNNAGIHMSGELEAVPTEEGRRLFETNFWGAISVSTAAIRFFREVNKPSGGVLLQNSSIRGRQASGGSGFYSASKFALEGASEALSRELDPRWDIKVIIIEPGLFRTNAWDTTTNIFTHPAYEKNPGLEGSRAASHYRQLRPEMISGDPSKLSAALLRIADMEHPPLRVLLGKDAWRMYEENEEKGLEERGRLNLKSWSDDLEFA